MSKNEITGDEIATKVPSDAYLAKFDSIFASSYQVTILNEDREEEYFVVEASSYVDARQVARFHLGHRLLYTTIKSIEKV